MKLMKHLRTDLKNIKKPNWPWLLFCFAVAVTATGIGARIHAEESVLANGLASPTDTVEFLKRFHRDPKTTMNSPFAKWDETGKPVPADFTAFGTLAPSKKELLAARASVRDRLCRAGGRKCDPTAVKRDLRMGLNEKNQISLFLIEPEHLETLSEMEERKLLEGQSPRAPWSDSFWPAQKGLIARRWIERGFPDSRNFMDNYNYFLANPPGSNGLNTMSPAEKYDYLVGDYSYRLTNANWDDGKSTWDKKGAVPGWAGICHGWSPAAILTPAPKKSVTVIAANGRPITFYPSDIKALSSSAFANSPPKNYFAGSRCNTGRPTEDEFGRVIDPACWDVNPATWHMAIVNEMGVHRRSFVIDAQYDFQIWNYPLYSYRYSYFNPQTLTTSDTLGGAAVAIDDFVIDKFKKYRSADAKYEVGIAMEISYAIETAPSTKPLQTPKLHAVKMLYDLELDRSGKIIGGEWYSNFHPDFIWHFAPDSQPISKGELGLTTAPTWNGDEPISEGLQEAARVSSREMQPLAVVIQTLVKLSQDVAPPESTSPNHPQFRSRGLNK